MSTSSNHYLVALLLKKTQTLRWITWNWLYRVDLQHLPLCTCEWIFQQDILVESSYAKSHIKWYKCILWNYCIAPWNPTPHMLFCLCHVSWKRFVVAKKHHMCFCFSYLARARNFQERLSSLVICLFYSCHLSLTISTFQFHHSRLSVLQQDHFCFHILWSFVTVNMFLGLFSLKGSWTSQESNCLIWTIPFL